MTHDEFMRFVSGENSPEKIYESIPVELREKVPCDICKELTGYELTFQQAELLLDIAKCRLKRLRIQQSFPIKKSSSEKPVTFEARQVNEQEKPGRQLNAKITVDYTDLDAAIEKANRLVELLAEASNIIDSFTSGNEKCGR